jgi:hypothetical protein
LFLQKEANGIEVNERINISHFLANHRYLGKQTTLYV